jgi:hypothetical protein
MSFDRVKRFRVRLPGGTIAKYTCKVETVSEPGEPITTLEIEYRLEFSVFVLMWSGDGWVAQNTSLPIKWDWIPVPACLHRIDDKEGSS